MSQIITEEQREILNEMCFGANMVKLGDLLITLDERIEEGPTTNVIEWGEF